MILPLPVAHLITLPIVCHVRVRAAVKAPPRKKLAERRARFSSAGPWIQKSLRGKKTRREEKERIRETVAGKSSVTSSRRIRTCLLKAIVFCFWEKQRRRVAPKTQKKKKPCAHDWRAWPAPRRRRALLCSAVCKEEGNHYWPTCRHRLCRELMRMATGRHEHVQREMDEERHRFSMARAKFCKV